MMVEAELLTQTDTGASVEGEENKRVGYEAFLDSLVAEAVRVAFQRCGQDTSTQRSILRASTMLSTRWDVERFSFIKCRPHNALLNASNVKRTTKKKHSRSVPYHQPAKIGAYTLEYNRNVSEAIINGRV